MLGVAYIRHIEHHRAADIALDRELVLIYDRNLLIPERAADVQRARQGRLLKHRWIESSRVDGPGINERRTAVERAAAARACLMECSKSCPDSRLTIPE